EAPSSDKVFWYRSSAMKKITQNAQHSYLPFRVVWLKTAVLITKRERLPSSRRPVISREADGRHQGCS
ncbi:MAG TPA: hypothetical protein PKZ39_06020, partial [Clostridia bacterium]|nr:hypothetical protein [Clostridia bacterium]